MKASQVGLPYLRTYLEISRFLDASQDFSAGLCLKLRPDFANLMKSLDFERKGEIEILGRKTVYQFKLRLETQNTCRCLKMYRLCGFLHVGH